VAVLYLCFGGTNIVDAYQLRRMIVGPCAMTGLVDW